MAVEVVSKALVDRALGRAVADMVVVDMVVVVDTAGKGNHHLEEDIVDKYDDDDGVDDDGNTGNCCSLDTYNRCDSDTDSCYNLDMDTGCDCLFLFCIKDSFYCILVKV